MRSFPKVSKDKRQRVFARFPRCLYCGREYGTTHMTCRTIDHLVPVSKGGSNAETNLVGCCRTCNCSKRDRTPAEWAADILAAVAMIEAT